MAFSSALLPPREAPAVAWDFWQQFEQFERLEELRQFRPALYRALPVTPANAAPHSPDGSITRSPDRPVS